MSPAPSSRWTPAPPAPAATAEDDDAAGRGRDCPTAAQRPAERSRRRSRRAARRRQGDALPRHDQQLGAESRRAAAGAPVSGAPAARNASGRMDRERARSIGWRHLAMARRTIARAVIAALLMAAPAARAATVSNTARLAYLDPGGGSVEQFSNTVSFQTVTDKTPGLVTLFRYAPAVGSAAGSRPRPTARSAATPRADSRPCRRSPRSAASRSISPRRFRCSTPRRITRASRCS